MYLKNVATVRSGFTPPGRMDDVPDGVLAIQQGDFSVEGFGGVEFMSRTGDQVARHVLAQRDILFRSRGQHTTAWVLPEEITEPVIAVMPLFVIRPDPSVVDAHYLAWFINQRATQHYFRQTSQGQTIQMISKTVLEDVGLTLPPIERQHVIANAARQAAKAQELERRLLRCRHELLTLQLEHAAHDFPETAR